MDAVVTISDRTASRGRWAVAAMFFANGFIIGSWAPEIPPLLVRLGITPFTLGLLILGFGLGALVSMPFAGAMAGRHGSRRVTIGLAFPAAFGLTAVVLAPNVAVAAVAMFAFGGLVGGMDVAMNANAVEVERQLGRAVMSSSHGFWSLGGFAGGAIGGTAIERFGAVPHALFVGIVAAALVASASRALIGETPAPQVREASGRRFSLPGGAAIYLVGLIALFAMTPEGAVLDWAALYLRRELGASLTTAGFAFAAFSASMAAMRFAGDAVRDRFGAAATFRWSALVCSAGMLMAWLAPSPGVAIAAFAIAGLGIANMVPIVFSAGGNQPGLSPGAGLSVVTTMGYSGILVAPSAIGFVGDRIGFAPIYLAVAVIMLGLAAAAPLVRSADRSEI